jgi:putative PIN family toxin of toxin-antitoxin system
VRAVLDTNVFVSGLLLPRSVPGQIVAAWRGGQFGAVLSEPMLLEIGQVLAYPKISKRLCWSEETLASYLTLLRFETEVVVLDAMHASVPRDADDDMVLATLLASGADFLVTGDQDLLVLAGQHSIVTPADFARRIF